MSPYCVKYTKHGLLSIYCLLISCCLRGQDPQFSQFFATRMYVNPAFAGNTHYARFSTQFRRQWPALQGYTTEGVYFDYNAQSINSGLGLAAIQDRQAGGALVHNRVIGMYSYGFTLWRKHMFRLGINTAYNSYNIDLSRFTFTDQLLSGGTQTSDEYRFSKLSYFDFGFGGLYYTKNYWVGASVNHFGNQSPRRDILNNPFPIRYSLHGGYLIPVNKDAAGKFYKSVTIAGHYKHQAKFDQLDIGAFYGFSKTIFGVWYRGMALIKNNRATPINHDALVFVFGVVHAGMRITYSYDATISPLSFYSGGAHELTFQFDMWRNRKRKFRLNSQREAPCPDFGPGWQT